MLNMNETIRARRRALGLTQEQAAQRLGVSAAAVSKWELGASYPDVTLLPALARLLQIDLNTLMGFEREPEQKEISAMLMDILDCARSQGIDAAIERAQALLHEYPSCGALLFGLAATLEGRMMMSGMAHAQREKHEALLMGWYRRAADSADTEASEAAAQLLAAKYLARGELDQAQAMMNRLPREPVSPRWPLEVSLLMAKGEEIQAKKLLCNALFRRAGDVQQLLARLVQAELDEGNIGKAQKLAEVTRDFVELLHMHPYTGHLAQLLPALKRQDEEECIKHIRAMLDALKMPWSPGEGLLYAHSDVKKGGHADMLAGVIRELRESEEYAFLREKAEFNRLLADHTQA